MPAETLEKLTSRLRNARWAASDLESTVREFATAEGLGLGKIAQPLRVALSGRTVSLGVFDMMEILGREESLARLEACVKRHSEPRPERTNNRGRRMTNQAHRTAKLAIGDKSLELPVYQGTIGPDVIDIRSLYSEGGVFTFDPGYTSTGSCESAITYIDGDKGELLYRGYPIEQLAEKSSFLEVSYLLLYGELPTAAQLEDFVSRVTNHTMLHEQMSYFFRGFRRDAHPMAIVCGTMGAMAAFYHDSTDISDAWQREVATIRMIAKMPTIVAWAYKYSVGQPFVYPRNSLDYAVELPQHVLRGSGRGLCGRPDPQPCHGPHLHAARRSRAERLHLDGAARVLLGRQSVRLHRGGRRLSLGSGAWRRQRGRACACCARSAPSTAFRSSSRGPRTRTIPSA